MLAAVSFVTAPLTAYGQRSAGCTADSTYAALDFWIGTWQVYVADTLIGTNRIAKVLEGCAVTEDWQDRRGGRGQSLFYVEPERRQWKQVWVTEAANRPGGVKEKLLVARLPGGGVRFQGSYRRDGRVLLDRTSLTPLPNGDVRQLIEVSGDNGASWHPTFDARYRRMP